MYAQYVCVVLSVTEHLFSVTFRNLLTGAHTRLLMENDVSLTLRWPYTEANDSMLSLCWHFLRDVSTWFVMLPNEKVLFTAINAKGLSWV